jgi:hypothetical protein
MKTVAVWSGISALAFVIIGAQMGVFSKDRRGDDAETVEEQPAKPATPGATFPDDLAPAAQAKPVRAAADYKPNSDPHPVVFLRLNGTVHPWQETVREDWRADTVATTELAVVLGVPKKVFVDRTDYVGGAPSITRYIFELEVSVIEAKTGRILANRLFRNTPRPVQRREAWEITGIGKAVSQQQVFSWVSRLAKSGFPETHDPTPIITQVD